MGGPTTGAKLGSAAKTVVLGAKHTAEEAAGFDVKRGYLSRSEAVRLALAAWPGVSQESGT